MGVFTTSRQVVMGLNLRPPWWLSGASVDLDFKNQRYYDSSLAVGTQSLAPLANYISCSRASTGYAKTSTGLLTSFGNNALRITDLGLLVEEARTNLCLSSSDLSNSTYWTTNNVTVTVNATTAPDGTTTATKQQATGSTSQLHWAGSNSFSATSATPFTVSCFVKLGSGNTWTRLECTDEIANDFHAWFNLATGVVGSTGNLGDGAVASSSIEAYGNGWFRISVTGQFATTRTCGLQVWSPVAGDTSTTSTSGDFLYVWGGQIEQAAFATSYIPTTSASVTRAADQITCAGALSTLLLAVPGTAYTDLDLLAAPTNFWRFIGGQDDKTLLSAFAAGNNTGITIYNGGASLNVTVGGGLGLSTGVKIAEAQAASTGRSIVGGGGFVATDTNTTAAVLTAAYLGSESVNPAYTMNGYMRRVTAWNSQLANTTLRALTYPDGATDLSQWVNNVVANGGSVSSARQALVEALIEGLKTDGVWSKLDMLWLFAGENSQSALTDLVYGFLASASTSPTFTTDRGYTGNGTSTYVNISFPLTTAGFQFQQNSASIFGWSNTAAAQTNSPLIGTSNNNLNIQPYTGGNTTWACNATTNVNTTNTAASGQGLFTASRTSSTLATIYRNTTSLGTDGSTSGSISATNPSFLALPGNGLYSAAQICAGGFGGGLTATDVTNLYNRLRTYLTAVGVP